MREDIQVLGPTALYAGEEDRLCGGYSGPNASMKPQHRLVKPPALARERTVHSDPRNTVCLLECTHTSKQRSNCWHTWSRFFASVHAIGSDPC